MAASSSGAPTIRWWRRRASTNACMSASTRGRPSEPRLRASDGRLACADGEADQVDDQVCGDDHREGEQQLAERDAPERQEQEPDDRHEVTLIEDGEEEADHASRAGARADAQLALDEAVGELPEDHPETEDAAQQPGASHLERLGDPPPVVR